MPVIASDHEKGCATPARPLPFLAFAARTLVLVAAFGAASPVPAHELDAAERAQVEALVRRERAVAFATTRNYADYHALAGDLHPDLSHWIDTGIRAQLARDDDTFHRNRKLVRKLFPCVATRADLGRIPERDFVATMLSVDTISVVPSPDEVELDILEVVPHGDDMLYVLWKGAWKTLPRGDEPAVMRDMNPGVVTLRRAEGGWKLLLHDPSADLSMLQSGFGKLSDLHVAPNPRCSK